MKTVSDVTRSGPVSLLDVRSCRCWGRTPSVPPADPAGNERIAYITQPFIIIIIIIIIIYIIIYYDNRTY